MAWKACASNRHPKIPNPPVGHCTCYRVEFFSTGDDARVFPSPFPSVPSDNIVFRLAAATPCESPTLNTEFLGGVYSEKHQSASSLDSVCEKLLKVMSSKSTLTTPSLAEAVQFPSHLTTSTMSESNTIVPRPNSLPWTTQASQHNSPSPLSNSASFQSNLSLSPHNNQTMTTKRPRADQSSELYAVQTSCSFYRKSRAGYICPAQRVHCVSL